MIKSAIAAFALATLIAPAARFNYGLTETWEAVLEGQVETPLSPSGPSTVTAAGAFLKGVLREGSLQNKAGLSVALPLTGWNNCAFYGTNTYTCDSAESTSRDEAAKAQQRIAQEILSCFGGIWADASEQAGPDFVVLHPKLGPTSITLNLGETDTNMHIVSLIMFLRR